MKIRTKLTLGVGTLFFCILLLGVLGTYYINVINRDTQNILVANYNTLDYAREMMIALDENISSDSSKTKFDVNLKKQQNNITEIGEGALTSKLAIDFEHLKTTPSDSSLYISIRKDLEGIMLLNMEAIQRKSDLAKTTAESATRWIGLTGTICFLISLILLMNLPSNIANPIKELTQSIKQIAEKKYEQRVHFEGHNEFGELARSFNTMATKLQEYNNSSLSRLIFEKKRVETLINNMYDAVIGLDESRRILFVNQKALSLIGMKEVQLIGFYSQDIAIHNDLMRLLMSDLFSSIEGKLQKKSIKIVADNKENYFDEEIIPISITPTGELIEQTIGHFIVLKNITPFKELDFAKTNFIATISHELKTPISTIKASLNLLENKATGILNDEQKQLIGSIKEDSNRLLKITSELLNLSQVETGNIKISMQQSDPVAILNYALETVQVQADQKGLIFKVEKPEAIPNVKADSEKTVWVLVNLLTNAIRYSNENQEINVKIVPEKKFLFFYVKDYGLGIESKYTDKIFNRYFQVPGSSKAGTGLGLSISKEFIDAQGGTIGVTSEFGKGSTFYFSLQISS